jgi:hypothetical protein
MAMIVAMGGVTLLLVFVLIGSFSALLRRRP